MRFFDTGADAVGIIAIGGTATGVIAIGGIAQGVIAIGGVSLGVVAVGQAAFGVFTLAQIGAGLLAALCQLGIGLHTCVAQLGVAGRLGRGGVLTFFPPKKSKKDPHTLVPLRDLLYGVVPSGWIDVGLRNKNDALEILDGDQPVAIALDEAVGKAAAKVAASRYRRAHLFVESREGGDDDLASWQLIATKLARLEVPITRRPTFVLRLLGFGLVASALCFLYWHVVVLPAWLGFFEGS